MKLVERVLQNISSEEISEMSAHLNMPASQVNSIITILIPGILSAFKAHIVSSMNSGDVTPLLDILMNTQNDITIKDLFHNNHQALDILYNRVNEFSNLPPSIIPEVINVLMPTISKATSIMLQEHSVNLLINDTDNNDYIQQLITNDNGYADAINDANTFLNSVFNTPVADNQTAPKDSQLTDDNLTDDNFLQNLFDLFDQDNDGSVMDDIYHMLIK